MSKVAFTKIAEGLTEVRDTVASGYNLLRQCPRNKYVFPRPGDTALFPQHPGETMAHAQKRIGMAILAYGKKYHSDFRPRTKQTSKGVRVWWEERK